jgi:hypothetical protein|tara:strand:- start:8022 stop:8141 length:120 start_codon:yes stop_codon:yes gene_type:complete
MDSVSKGVVTQLLSAQFTFKDEEGHTQFVLYNENWKKIK